MSDSEILTEFRKLKQANKEHGAALDAYVANTKRLIEQHAALESRLSSLRTAGDALVKALNEAAKDADCYFDAWGEAIEAWEAAKKGSNV